MGVYLEDRLLRSVEASHRSSSTSTTTQLRRTSSSDRSVLPSCPSTCLSVHDVSSTVHRKLLPEMSTLELGADEPHHPTTLPNVRTMLSAADDGQAAGPLRNSTQRHGRQTTAYSLPLGAYCPTRKKLAGEVITLIALERPPDSAYQQRVSPFLL